MKCVLLLIFTVFLFITSTANPVQPRYQKDTLQKKNKNFADRFKFKKQKKVKKTQDIGCWICEPLNHASDVIKKAYTPRYDDPCSTFVWLLLLPVIIIVTVAVVIYAMTAIALILLLGSAILFGLYALLLISMGITLAGWYIWGGIIGAILVFTVFYFTFCRLCRK